MRKIIQALKSRTVLFAIAQAVTSLAILVFTQADMIGVALLIKSAADIWLRAGTVEPLSSK